MILQTDSRLNSKFLHDEGCCIFSCLYILNKKYGLKLSPAKIKNICRATERSWRN